MKRVILKGPRVTLRPPNLSDANYFCTAFRDKEVAKYLSRQDPISLKDEIKWIKSLRKNEHEKVLTIVTENGKVIGNCAVRLDEKSRSANLGIVIGDKTEWGKGYAFETIKLLINFVFKDLKLNRFDLKVDTKNKRAIHCYTKLGFIKEGRLRQSRWNKITKEFDDSYIMSILKSKWEKSKSSAIGGSARRGERKNLKS